MKLPSNWRIENALLQRRKWSNSKVEWIFYAARSGITYSESIGRSRTKSTRTIGVYWRFEILLWSWLTEQLWQCLLDEIRMNHAMIQEIWRHYRRFWEKELRKLRAKNHCNQYLYLAFRWEQDKTSRRWKVSHVRDEPCCGYWDLYSRHDNSELSLLGCICKNCLTKRNFRAWSWISEQKFAQRRRISRSSVESWQKESGKILTPIGRLKNVFSGGLLGLVRKETIVTRMPRDAVRLWQTDVKQSKGQSCD